MPGIACRSALILAMDVTDRQKALAIAEAVRGSVDAVKVGWPSVLGCGPDLITELAKHGPVICDFKVADIPNTNALIAREAKRLGASAIIGQAFPGSDSVKALVDEMQGAVYLVCEMSHPGGAEYTQAHAEDFARMARDAGCAGIVAPATRPERLRALKAIVGDLQVISPGVGTQGGSAGDAIRSGADLLIVGRSIYGAPDPAAAARKLTEEIEAARKG